MVVDVVVVAVVLVVGVACIVTGGAAAPPRDDGAFEVGGGLLGVRAGAATGVESEGGAAFRAAAPASRTSVSSIGAGSGVVPASGAGTVCTARGGDSATRGGRGGGVRPEEVAGPLRCASRAGAGARS